MKYESTEHQNQRMANATEGQWREQVLAVQMFAEALAEGRIPLATRWAAVKRLKDATDTLVAWTPKEVPTA